MDTTYWSCSIAYEFSEPTFALACWYELRGAPHIPYRAIHGYIAQCTITFSKYFVEMVIIEQFSLRV